MHPILTTFVHHPETGKPGVGVTARGVTIYDYWGRTVNNRSTRVHMICVTVATAYFHDCTHALVL